MATTGPPARPWSSSPSAESGSIPPGRPHHGRCHLMRACLQDDGCTSSRSAGSRRLTEHIPRWPSFSATAGYATAGFVANTFYCASDSGLARGFTHYQDFIFPELTALKTAVLVSRALDGFQTIVYFTEDWLESAGLLPYVERFWRSWTPIARRRRKSIASSWTGSTAACSRSGRFSLS